MRWLGVVLAIIGGLPVVGGALILGLAGISKDTDAFSAGIVAAALIGAGLLPLAIGLALVFVDAVRDRRRDLSRAHDEDKSGTSAHTTDRGNMAVSVVGAAMCWFPLVGLPCALYGFFGNPEKTSARRVGLAAVFMNLALAVALAIIPNL